ASSFLRLDDEGLEKLTNEVATLKHVTLKTQNVVNRALFLASEEGRYVSGHNLLIDGGLVL
ncbi:NAD(P)-binding domain containing protein, partial [Trema orientale]